MKITTISIQKEDSEKAKQLAEYHRVKMYELFTLMIDFFDRNKEVLTPEILLEKEGKMVDLLEQKITKNMTKQVNRLIGFTKTQDELLLDIQQEIRQSTKKILFKLIPKEEQEFAEYNPLFDDFDQVILLLKKLLDKKGISSKDIEKEIQKELGDTSLKKYQESSEKIRVKNFLDISPIL